MLKQFENNPDFSAILKTAQKEFEEQGTYFLEETYLRSLNDRLNLFPRTIDAICQDAASVRADREASCYALFVFRAMEHRDLFHKHLPLFTFPQETYSFFPLLCLIPTIPDIHRFLVMRNLPQDVIANTLGQFEDCIFIYSQRYDHLGLNKRYFDWLQHYVDHEIFNINRLRFEILTLQDPIYLLQNKNTGESIVLMGEVKMNPHGLYADAPPVEGPSFQSTFRETDTHYLGNPVSPAGRCQKEPVCLSKADYRILAQQGDTCLSIHIPNTGDFSHKSCEESYARAKELFLSCFPELTIKAFHCHSWMMAPELNSILKPGSRITDFAGKYLRYPIPTEGEDVLNFVFLLKFKTYEDLAEDTSLQRALKKLYVNGQYLYEYGGICPL